MKNYISRDEDFCHVFDFMSTEIRSNLIKPFTDQTHNKKTKDLLLKLPYLKADFFDLVKSHNSQGIDNRKQK